MKRVLCMGFILLFLLLYTVPAAANSAPSYWSAYPNSEILTIDKYSPIKVTSEQLLLNFSDNRTYDSYKIPVGIITASYQMTNPTDKPLSVQMAFPYTTNISTIASKADAVLVDGKALPYKLRFDIEASSYIYSGANAFL